MTNKIKKLISILIFSLTTYSNIDCAAVRNSTSNFIIDQKDYAKEDRSELISKKDKEEKELSIL